jgi:hypothetical protein
LTVATFCLFGTVGAQTNFFEIYPETAGAATTFFTRFTLGAAEGELFQGVPGTMFVGVGGVADVGGQATCQATQWQIVTQDQNCATLETYDLVYRKADPNGAPIPGVAGEIVRVPNLTTPANGPVGACAWRITGTFATPVNLPCQGGFLMGVKLAANAVWSTDGQSLHSAHYTSGTMGDWPRAGAPHHCYQINASQVVSQPSVRTTRMAVGTLGAVANAGGQDPLNTRQPAPPKNYGGGGMYPDLGGVRKDGLYFRTRDLGSAGGLSIVFLGVPNSIPGGIGAPGIIGRLWLLPSPLFAMGVIPIDATTGIGDVEMVAPGTMVLIGVDLNYQGVNVNATFTQVKLTNLAAQKL